MLIIRYVLLFIWLLKIESFISYFRSNIKRKIFMKQNNPFELSKSWEYTGKKMKKRAREWFIERAEKKGIKWNEYLEPFKSVKAATELLLLKDILENKTVKYPNYFLKPFHGYDKGNMNWQAAKEGEGATVSMSVNYWNDVTPEESELWLRTNYTNTIKNYSIEYPEYILDVGSSFGIGTEFIKLAFNESTVQGLDLSPYFVAISSFRSSLRQNNISFIHANAEEIPIPDECYDLVTVQYLFHEVPREPTQKIINDIYRVLKPNGTLAIIDLDPRRLKKGLNTNVFRRWAFEVTEPHIYEYYNSNMTTMMNSTGFTDIKETSNDPMNNVWLGRK